LGTIPGCSMQNDAAVYVVPRSIETSRVLVSPFQGSLAEADIVQDAHNATRSKAKGVKNRRHIRVDVHWQMPQTSFAQKESTTGKRPSVGLRRLPQTEVRPKSAQSREPKPAVGDLVTCYTGDPIRIIPIVTG
jgi:hypothetical protein